MFKKIIYVIAFLLSVTLTAQESKAMEKLGEYDLSSELILEALEAAHPGAGHAFNVTITSETDDETIVEKAKFDPTKKNAERWVLVSYNGQVPSDKEVKAFNKEFNKKESIVERNIDEASLKILQLNDESLVIGFKYKPSSLPARYGYLADCRGKAYVNLKTKELEKVEFTNEKPVKVWPLKVQELKMVVDYAYSEADKKYQVQKETLDMQVKALGNLVEVRDVFEYSNYERINPEELN